MKEVKSDYNNQTFEETNTRIRSLEEKQRLLKSRLLLIGQNLIEMREEQDKTSLEIKKDIEILKQTIEKVKSFLETASNEFPKFARKEELEILSKQARIFQPI